jgi:hypothetical protein
MEEDFPFEERDSDGNFIYSKSPVGSNDEYKTPERISIDRKVDRIIDEQSQLRQDVCWCDDCVMRPTAWVREVQFDLKGDKTGPDHRVVSTKDYGGPIPGFCFAHISEGPAQLAEVVYWDRTEISLGLRPLKWWVIFTDGTKQGGLCTILNPKNLKPSTCDVHIKSSQN